MKNIAEKLKNARKKTGISIEEAAEDLNYKVSQLEDLESGNYKNFKDKFILKTIVTDYSKYLGLDVEEVIDEFNDFVFESTSKIPIDDIAKASKLKEKQDDVKIASPYTATEEKNKVPKYLYVLLILTIIIAIVVVVLLNLGSNSNSSFNVSLKEVQYEERI